MGGGGGGGTEQMKVVSGIHPRAPQPAWLLEPAMGFRIRASKFWLVMIESKAPIFCATALKRQSQARPRQTSGEKAGS